MISLIIPPNIPEMKSVTYNVTGIGELSSREWERELKAGIEQLCVPGRKFSTAEKRNLNNVLPEALVNELRMTWRSKENFSLFKQARSHSFYLSYDLLLETYALYSSLKQRIAQSPCFCLSITTIYKLSRKSRKRMNDLFTYLNRIKFKSFTLEFEFLRFNAKHYLKLLSKMKRSKYLTNLKFRTRIPWSLKHYLHPAIICTLASIVFMFSLSTLISKAWSRFPYKVFNGELKFNCSNGNFILEDDHMLLFLNVRNVRVLTDISLYSNKFLSEVNKRDIAKFILTSTYIDGTKFAIRNFDELNLCDKDYFLKIANEKVHRKNRRNNK